MYADIAVEISTYPYEDSEKILSSTDEIIESTTTVEETYYQDFNDDYPDDIDD